MARKPRTTEPKKAPDEPPWPRSFTVTAKAGPKVANRRVSPGETVTLEESEAAHELRIGSIKPVEATADAVGESE